MTARPTTAGRDLASHTASVEGTRAHCRGLLRAGRRRGEAVGRGREIDGQLARIVAGAPRLATCRAHETGDATCTFDVPALLHEVVRGLRGVAGASGVAVRLSSRTAHGGVVADRDAVRRVVEDVFRRAIAAASPGGAVTVSLVRRTDRLVIRVGADGPPTDGAAGGAVAACAFSLAPPDRCSTIALEFPGERAA